MWRFLPSAAYVMKHEADVYNLLIADGQNNHLNSKVDTFINRSCLNLELPFMMNDCQS